MHCTCGHLDIEHTLYNSDNPSHRACSCETCNCTAFNKALLNPNQPKQEHCDHFLFLDYETTGEPEHRLLEVGWMLTDTQLEKLIECQSTVIHQDCYTMSDTVLKMHTRNGLLTEVAQSTTEVYQAEQRIIQTIQPIIECNASRIVLAGFSCHFDRELMRRDMSTLNSCLHYRHLDISVPRTMYSCWVEKIPSKKDKHPHRAKDDVIASWEIAKTFMTIYQLHMPKLKEIPDCAI